jgi:hypothetical protein
VDVRIPKIDEQDDFLGKIGMKDMIPYNSDNRRNVGYLMAIEDNVDFVISLDDDNFCIEGSKPFNEHSIVSKQTSTHKKIDSNNNWVNICEMIDFDKDVGVYPRGFPYHKRHESKSYSYETDECNIKVNAGLWLSDPDIDAITWLNSPVQGNEFTGDSVVLGESTWSPINTQNTGIANEAVTAYYFVPMGYPIKGHTIDRYGDIFSGYFLEAVCKSLGHDIRFGTPVADHRRNAHNFMKDARGEFGGMIVLEDLVSFLTDLKLDGNTYEEAYLSLSYQLQEGVEKFSGSIWDDTTRAYFHRLAHLMRRWVKACKDVRREGEM